MHDRENLREYMRKKAIMIEREELLREEEGELEGERRHDIERESMRF